MKKSELKQILLLYPQIEKALVYKSEMIEIKRNRRTERMKISSWMYKLPEIISLMERAEQGTIVGSIIEKNIRKRQKDQKILRVLAVSESTYYRLKRQILEKIYNLYASLGDVTLEEILAERID